MENDVEGDEWVATEFESKDIIPNATNNNFSPPQTQIVSLPNTN